MQIQGGTYIIFIMAWVGNLHKEQVVTLYFFIMAEVVNLDTCLGGYFSLLKAQVGNLLEKITDLMFVIIRGVVGLMAGCF